MLSHCLLGIDLAKCLTRIALGLGELFGWLNRARRLCHFFTFIPSSTSRRIASGRAGSRWRATSRSDISWPPCALVVCPAYAVFRGLKQRQEIMSATEILKSAFTLALYITATTTTLATAQEATFSEGERLGLAACLSKCPDNDKACNNRCISNSQTKGRVWGDDVRACIRGCRVGTQMKDQIFGCITGCRLDRIVR